MGREPLRARCLYYSGNKEGQILTRRASEGSAPAPSLARRASMRFFRAGVILEVVRMLAVGDLDRHLARETFQLTGAGVRHDGDTQSRDTAGHGPAVLEDEAAAATMQRPGDPLDRDVAR